MDDCEKLAAILSTSDEVSDLRAGVAAVLQEARTLSLQKISKSGLGRAIKLLTKHEDGAIAGPAMQVYTLWKERVAESKRQATGPVVAAALPAAALRAPALDDDADASAAAGKDVKDYHAVMRLKPDSAQKPFWVCADSRIILEMHSPVYKEAEALLIAIAEPVSRTRYLQEYQLTDYSLYAGASMGLKTREILSAMERFSKNELPPQVRQKIHDETSRYGKVKLVMRSHQLFIECRNQPEVLSELLRDPELAQLRPRLRLERVQLRVVGRQRKAFSGTVRFLPSEALATFGSYRRLTLRYSSMSALRAVPREVYGREPPAAGAARLELRFRLVLEGEDELKKLHNALVLEAREFDPANPAYNPASESHYLQLAFSCEADRRRFGELVLPDVRSHAPAVAEAEARRSLDGWLDGPLVDAMAGAGMAAGAAAGAHGPGAAGAAEGEAEGEEAVNEEERIRRRAEDAEVDVDAAPTAIEEFEVDPSKVKEVKARCRAMRWPLLEEYDFRNDTANPELPIELKHDDSRIRDYQEQALARVFGNHRARSGIIVLPCGAGKTLVGIVAACTVKRSTLVLSNTSVSCEQWYQQFLMWTNIDRSRIIKFTSGKKEPLHKDACILISTYNMIGYTGPRAAEARALMADVEQREWGLCVLDEVHVAPADTFLTCMTTRTRSRCKLGLTATLVREDGKIDVLNAQIGPKLFEANWLDLQERGYIAKVSCAEVWCSMTPEFYREYLRASQRLQRVLYAMNPDKFRACEFLMNFHEARGDKIIIFSDNVFALREYAKKLKRPRIDGDVNQNERMKWLGQFKTGGSFSTILISKVGDTAIDLPEANVIIQIASHFGARRQEAQRLGRILRPKARTGDAYNAFFYTLVSRDTQEMFYATKRQQFLVDQGYAFKVITELTGMGEADGLSLSTQKEQLDWLGLTLSYKADEFGAAEAREDQEAARSHDMDEGAPAPGASGVKRKPGSMSELSGAGGVRYAEVPVVQAGQSKLLREYSKKQKQASKAKAAS